MTDTMTNPSRESSGSLREAATRFGSILNPQESAPADQPEEDVQNSSEAEVDSEAQQPEVEESEESQDSEDQPEAEEDGAEEEPESGDSEVFLIGGEEVTADQLLEWKNSGLRQDDYTRKSQALAEDRRALEGEVEQEKSKLRAEYEQKLAQFSDFVIDDLKQYESIDWDDLRENDPYSYNTRWADYQRAQLRAQKAAQAIQQEQAQWEREQKEARTQRLAEAQKKVVELIPELKNPEAAKSLMSDMTDYLKSVGMSEEAISSIEDPYAYKVIHDAMRYNKLSSKAKEVGKKKVSPVTKVVKPGAVTSKATVVERDAKVREQERNRLKKTGDFKDAVDIFRRVIN